MQPDIYTKHKTYRIIRLSSLAQARRSCVDFLDHAREILAHIIQTSRQLLSQLVHALTLLIRTLQIVARSQIPVEELINVLLIAIQPPL